MTNAGKARKIRCVETGEVFASYREAGKAIGVNYTPIRRVVLGEKKSVKGLHFEFVEENAQEGVELPVVVQNEHGEPIPVIDSREVARMMGISHSNILKYIEGDESSGVISIAKVIAKVGTAIGDYFIPSTYLANNRECRCYLVTKQGCELLGNKQQGEKGILFSLAYVEKFNAMEKELRQSKELVKDSYMIDDPIKRAERWIEEQKEKQLLADKLEEQAPKVELADERLSMNGCISITDANKTFGLGKGKLMQWARNKGFIDKRKYIKEVNQAGRKYFKVYQTGEYRNIGITDEGMKLIKENKEEINSVKLTRNV